jgi:Copper type II ascorbate-dependent monooxygenase, C-terminal domain
VKGLVLSACTLATLLGCGSHDQAPSSEDVQFIEGFHPPALAPNEVRVLAPLVTEIPAGGDVSWCTYIENPFDGEVDVIQSRGFQSKFGHHAILMEVVGAESRLGDSHKCTDADMTNARFLAGGSDAAAQFKIPEGIAFRIKKKSVLMIQTHWINTSNAQVVGQAVFNIGVQPPDGKRQAAQLFAAYTANVTLPPRGPASAKTECKIQQEMSLFALGGHAHEWGTHVKLTVDRAGKNDMLYDHDWEPHFQADPPLNYYDTKTPLQLHAGDVLHVECEYQNTSDAEVRFPREMCVGLGFYFPGTADIQCGDGHWANGNGGMP